MKRYCKSLFCNYLDLEKRSYKYQSPFLLENSDKNFENNFLNKIDSITIILQIVISSKEYCFQYNEIQSKPDSSISVTQLDYVLYIFNKFNLISYLLQMLHIAAIKTNYLFSLPPFLYFLVVCQIIYIPTNNDPK